MNTLDKIKAAALEARKTKSFLRATLAYHVASITAVGKDRENRETTEDETVQYIKRAVNKLQEGGLGSGEECKYLESLLPIMVSEEELRAFISSLGLTQKGDIMKAVKEKYGQSVDMKKVSSMY